jgi:hypothetical protein
MAQYRRLSLMEREEVSRMLAAGHSLRASAQALHRASGSNPARNERREICHRKRGMGRGWPFLKCAVGLFLLALTRLLTNSLE